MKIKIFQFIKRFEFHPDINCLPLLSSPLLLLKRLNHHSVLLLASRTTNLVGLRKTCSLAGVYIEEEEEEEEDTYLI